MFSSFICRSRLGDGGAPPVIARTCRSSGAASSSAASDVSTVGAAQKWVTDSSRSACQTLPGTTARRHTCTPPAAVTAQGKHQPLVWNIGSVHKYLDERSSLAWKAIASACRYAPRWWYITPLGVPVVPLV